MSGDSSPDVSPESDPHSSDPFPEARTESVTRPQLVTEPEKYQLLLIGLDTLDVGIYADWGHGWEACYQQLESLKQEASNNRRSSSPIISAPPPGPYLVHPDGKPPMYRFHVQASDFHLWIAKNGTPQNNTPNLYLSLISESIWRSGLWNTLKRVTEALQYFGAEMLRDQPSRVDLCADFYVPGGFTEGELIEQTVCDSGEKRTFYNHSRLSSYYVGGPTGHIKMRLYNKSQEIEAHTDRSFFRNLWNVPRSKEVWRVEFQLSRTFLKEASLNTVADVDNRKQMLWEYLTQEWITLRTGTDRNKSRRPLSEFWQAVQKAGEALSGAEPIIPRHAPEHLPQEEWYLVRIQNYLVTLAALWKEMRPGEVLGKLREYLKERWQGKKFRRAVMVRAVEKGWPVPEKPNDQT